MPRRRLGQHFLTKGSVVNGILRALDLGSEDKVLEIGPGSGAMTLPLASKVKKIFLVEKDSYWAAKLQESLNTKNLEIINQDFLNLDFALVLKSLSHHFKVLSNLPYESSVAILLKLLQEVPPATMMVLMFQKEVADRLLASPGSKNYGSLSVWVQVLADLSHLRQVPPEAFKPPPQVESTVLKIIKKADLPLPLDALPALEQLLRAGFAKRRKMLRQNLKSFFTGATAKQLEARLQAIQASPQARAEELSVAQWLALLLN